MIIGIGHDMTDVHRIARLLDSPSGIRFMKRVLTDVERKLAEGYSGIRLHQYVAGRFAAKEAVVKALGCGIGGTVGFADIVISRDSRGKPECSLSEAAWRRLEQKPEQVRVHITITHERSLASAFAVAEMYK